MATLKNLVDEVGNIKNELVTCSNTLKNKLTDKDVSFNRTDKLLSLINKVGDIKTGKRYATGTIYPDTAGLFTVSNLSFNPTVIYARCAEGKWWSAYIKNVFIKNNNHILISMSEKTYEQVEYEVSLESKTAYCYIYQNSFRAYCGGSSGVYPVTWVAYE